ncbi:GntR family transcriptional regulator, partial [Alicyclobacillus acidiphilus]
MVNRYLEIREEILARIGRSEWTQGTRLPSENQLAKEYGVTRVTVRKALAALEQDRVLTTRQGVGRYVNPRSRIVSELTKLESTDKMMAVSNTTVRKQLVEFKDIGLDVDEATHLELEPGAPAVRMVRIRFASMRRAAVSVNIFPKECAPADPVDGSLLDTMDQLGYHVDYAQTEIIM